jgi:hypothetical protein
MGIFAKHFVEKGREAAQAALMIGNTREALAAQEESAWHDPRGRLRRGWNPTTTIMEAGLICVMTLAEGPLPR